MKIKCLYDFNSFSEFSKFTDFTEKINWKIEKQLLKNRVTKYSKLTYFIEFKHRFYDKKLSIFPLKDEEVITWFDTTVLLRRTLVNLYKKGVNTENLSIIMEYPVIFGNHMRSDYLLIIDRLIVVLEFGMFNQDERRSEERYTKKLQESISYRQIISNNVSNKIKVINYVLIYKPEFNDDLNISMIDNIKYNQLEVNKLVQFLELHISNENVESAKFQLENIANFD
ncbi:MAG: hypothetical protein AB7E61_04815 [Acholeplasmataceae bacterium]